MPTSTFNGVANNTHPTWWKDPSMRRNAFWLMLCALTTAYGGYDGSLLNGLQALPEFFDTFPQLATDSNLLGLTGAVQFLPSFIFPFIAAYLADRFGRKFPLILCAFGIIIGAVVQCTSHSLTQFILSRLIIGCFGSMGQTISGAALVELAHPRIRSVASALNNCNYYIGSILSSWITFGTLLHLSNATWSWRAPSLLQGAVPAIIVIPMCFMPQSPRWLISKGRNEQARQFLAAQHANGDLDDPLVEFEMQEITAALEMEHAINKNQSAFRGWSDFIKTSGNRKRLWVIVHVGIGAQWNGVGIVSYYLIPVLKSVGITEAIPQTLVNGGLAISNLLFAIGGAISVEKLGRRPLWFISTAGMLICFIVITALSAVFSRNSSPAVGGAVVAFLYLYYGMYDIAWTPLNIAYTAEVLPYHLRARGMALWQMSTAGALCINTWVNPIALHSIGYYYYIVYIGTLVYLLIVAYFTFPETKGLSLEEVAERFDGARASIHNLEEPSNTEEMKGNDVLHQELSSKA